VASEGHQRTAAPFCPFLEAPQRLPRVRHGCSGAPTARS
jgi:hypothetical protein